MFERHPEPAQPVLPRRIMAIDLCVASVTTNFHRCKVIRPGNVTAKSVLDLLKETTVVIVDHHSDFSYTEP